MSISLTTPVHFSNTTLKKEHYGKSEASKGDLALNINIQTHIPANPNERLVRYYASLAQNGTISIHRMILTWLKDNRTSNVNNISKPLFVAHSMDPREYQNRNNSTIYSDSNRHMIDLALTCNPWNSIITEGKIASLMVPNSKSTWNNDEHNKHVFDLIERLKKIQETQAPESTLNEAYQASWKEYQETEQKLLENQILVESNVLVANQSSIVPAITMAQDIRYKDDRYTGSKNVGNPNQLATYIPSINNVNGTLMFTTTLQDPRSEYEYGLRESQNTDNSKVLKTFSSEVIAFNFLNQEAYIPLSISISDLPYETQRSRAENFAEFKESSTFFEVRNALLVLRSVPKSLATTFHLTGDALSYKAKEMKGVEIYETPTPLLMEDTSFTDNSGEEF